MFVLTSNIVGSFSLIERSPELFDISELKGMSESDHIVKFWGHLVELVFTKTGLYPHLGDTVSEVCKQNNKRMKMDLRILCKAINNNDATDDLSTAEFAKHATNAKLYEDRTKLVVHAKMILNEIITSLGKNVTTTTDFRVCMLQVMGNALCLLKRPIYYFLLITSLMIYTYKITS
jgi:hypothetical protein